VSKVLRFSGFFNFQEQFHYNMTPHFGIYTGFGIRNVGFINKLNDSIKVKQRVYSAGIPLAIKLGNMDKSAYISFGGEMELFFNYKQKTFYNDSKSKFDEWFSDRTELLNPSVFFELKGKKGGHIRFKYYINDLLKAENQTVIVNGMVFHILLPKVNYIMFQSAGPEGKRNKIKTFFQGKKSVINFNKTQAAKISDLSATSFQILLIPSSREIECFHPN
jgi:hypothetical protein